MEENQKPDRILGLYLLVGMIVILISSLGFYAIAEDVVEKDTIVEFDQALVDFIHKNVTQQTVQLMQVATVAGNEFVDIASVALGIYFATRRRWQDLVLVVVAVGGSQILVSLIKLLVQRQRPFFTDPIQVIQQFSFPSGHSFWAMVFYGLVAYLILRTNRSPIVWIVVILSATAIILLVGFTRIYLGVHFLSDVVAGYLGGLAWLLVTITGVNFARRWRGRRRSRSVSNLSQA